MSQRVPVTAANLTSPRDGADVVSTWRDRIARASLSRRGQLLMVVVWMLVFAAHWAVMVDRLDSHSGDFDISREFGRRFLAGEPLYHGGLHYPYLPAAAAAFAPLALFDRQVAFTLRYALALACLWLTLRLLSGIVRERGLDLSDSERLLVAAVSVLFAAHYVFRDLADAGPQIILVFVLVAGIAAVARGRDGIGAACFGLATALKPPCALLIPFFLWTRRWRLALLTTIALAAWVALPMLWMGPRSWASHHVEWARTALASAAGAPVAGADESESRPQNQALRPLIMRLSGAQTPVAANVIALGVLVLVAFGMECGSLLPLCPGRLGARVRERSLARRKRWQAAALQTDWLAHSSAILVLSLLLSPVTWVQHLVLMLPALYVLVVTAHSFRPLGTGLKIAAGVYALMALVVNRELVGRTFYVELLNFGLQTACMLLVLGMVVWWRPATNTASES